MQQEVTLRALRQGDVDWLTRAHGRLYARDEGFDASFEALVAEIDRIREAEEGRSSWNQVKELAMAVRARLQARTGG